MPLFNHPVGSRAAEINGSPLSVKRHVSGTMLATEMPPMLEVNRPLRMISALSPIADKRGCGWIVR